MKVICRCQDVTEDEIVAAIRQGATTIDEIRRLVRSWYGLVPGPNLPTTGCTNYQSRA